MHLASLSIFQLDLRQGIVNCTAKNELYELVKDKLQQQSLEKRYEGYNWKKMDFSLINVEFIFRM